MTDRPRFEPSPLLVVVAVVVMASAVVAASFAYATYVWEISPSVITRDLLAIAGLPRYTGALSWIGVLIWFGASSIALFAAWLVTPPHRGFLRDFGLFGVVLSLDDGFTLHESRFESTFYVLYALASVYIAIRWWRILTPTARGFAIAAVIGLGASVGLDIIGGFPGHVEDAPKFVGIVAWAGVVVSQARYAIRTSGTERAAG